ncbi:manganese transport system membrane protein MntC [Phocicoccus schoeneichii]|uniref:Manganese transport system membrane protein MntC n=1 Tax=Phocicoccus schoeneichii TaxID=1812261 RepID=A0A6V7QZW3_9BACL|nr:metal ABC transporter permease [Jeotgalicoccus schoeneichii]GGH54633.1 manganese transport system membrane protein MntC [Jeotgalicoccus schoeneichii]CAD2070546.1 Manganese transport system membrane protein MntB [Jeotgalicoccus schoeneichii]
MISLFIEEVIQYGFFQKALLTGVAVGIVCGVIGCFIVLRGLALMGDAISHAILPGVAISYMLGINFFVGAAIVGLLAALGIGFINRNSIVKNDAAIGIVFSLFFAVGVLLIAKAKTAIDLTQILFGNVLTVSDTDRTMTLIIGGLVLLLVYVFYKELVLTSFDPVMAEASGMKVGIIHYLLMLMLTLVTVVSLQTVGVILVVSLLITPASTAYLLTHRMSTMIFLSAAIGAISAIVGLFFSFSFNLSSGPSIVVVATAIFILAFIFAPRRGLIAKYL